MNRFVAFGLLILLATLTSACQTNYGEGPLKLSHQSAKNFETYLDDTRSWNFAVSPNGNTTYYMYCPRGHSSCIRRISDLIHGCNKRSKTNNCKVLAQHRSISWKNPGNFMPYYSEIVVRELGQSYFSGKQSVNTGIVPQKEKPALPTSSDQTVVHLNWKGATELIQATFLIDHEKKPGTILTNSAESAYSCDGIFNYQYDGGGTWALTCTGDFFAKGMLSYNKNAEYFLGTGEDSLGKAIQFYLDTSATTKILKTVSN